ncbi:hypothetical protein BLNAU_16912 [Blattamonas nauphoetae]|uniref:Uncharacterized protein n=1 Tax=Blattamonas nauphoetae TaxID=2049346 RepID=A0ABQ9X7Z0_9EUKA|nr:hypothetical protein BLNAU_16912 [Blattamonas nauphoetae]
MCHHDTLQPCVQPLQMRRELSCGERARHHSTIVLTVLPPKSGESGVLGVFGCESRREGSAGERAGFDKPNFPTVPHNSNDEPEPPAAAATTLPPRLPRREQERILSVRNAEAGPAAERDAHARLQASGASAVCGEKGRGRVVAEESDSGGRV